MSFTTEEGVFTINLDMTLTLALAAAVVLLGLFLRKKFKFFQKYCIPAPVISGFIFIIFTCIGYMTNTFRIGMDTTLQNLFMVAFFTTVGLSANFALIKAGGKLLIKYWILAALIAALQGPIALLIGNVLGLENAYSMLAGAISMSGGHGGATAYGTTFVEMGYSTAVDVGIAAATFGLISSVIIGGPLARRLVVKHNLKSTDKPEAIEESNEPKLREKLSDYDICKNFAILLLCMGIGVWVADLLSDAVGMTIPQYLGAMIVSIIVINVNAKLNFFKYDADMFDGIGSASLDVFLAIAMMSIKLWQLVNLVGGILIIVLVQVIVMVFYAYFIVFRVMGKNYDAAVMVAGICGHGLGATPTALANMSSVRDQFGPSKKAFLVVPIVAAFLVEIVYQPITILLVNMFVPNIA